MEALGVVAWNSTVGSGEHCELAGNLNLNKNEEAEEQRREPGLQLKRIDELILIICNGRFRASHCHSLLLFGWRYSWVVKWGWVGMSWVGLGLGKVEVA